MASLPDGMLVVLLVLLIPLAIAGLALVNVGLGRSHSAAHAMLASLCMISVAAIVFVLWGARLEAQPGYIVMVGGRPWSLVGHMLAPGAGTGSALLLQVFAVGLAAVIPLSAGADRWRLGATCLASGLVAGVLYPLFAHWALPGGWLAQLGVNYGLGGGFRDAGGTGAIHTVGGLGALVVAAWRLGPRRNKYDARGAAAAIPGHNIVLVFSGCLVMLPGWIGLNAAWAMLYSGLPAGAVAVVVLNTLLSGAGGALAAVVLTRLRFGKSDASLSANGWVAGLVAGSAGCAWLTPLGAIATGLIAGVLILYSIEALELKLGIDDPAGAISVHGVAGLWGLLAVALFVRPTLPGQMLAQIAGVATLLGFVLPASAALHWAADRLYPYRVDDDGERQGMDLRELGAGAYPEFVVHRDEFSQR